jgi:hypothetical protein
LASLAPAEFELLRPHLKPTELKHEAVLFVAGQPLPILGNRTPMDAVKDPDGHEIVESLVIQAERNGRRPDLRTDENVFRRLRGRLGLAGSR